MSDCALKGAATKRRPPPSPERGRGPTVLCLPCCAWNFFPSEVTFASNSQREEEERGGPSTPFTSLLALEGRGKRERKGGATDRTTDCGDDEESFVGPVSFFRSVHAADGRTDADGGGLRWRRGNRLLPKKVGKTVRHDTGDHEADDGRRALLNDHPRTK